MRKIAFIALSALLLASCAPKKKGATISGNVANQAEGQVVFVINDVKDTVALDENGNFEYFLETEKAMYASVVHARNIVNLYIEPGKGFNLNTDAEDFANALTFKGTGAVANAYLAENSKIEKGIEKSVRSLMALEPADFVAKCDSVIKVKKENFAANVAEANVSEAFKKGEKARVLYSKANLYGIYPRYYAYLNKKDVPELPENFYAYKENLNPNDGDLLAIGEYKQYLSGYLNEKVQEAMEANPELDKEENSWATLPFKMVKEIFTDAKIIDQMIFEAMGNIVKYLPIEAIPSYIEKFNTICANQEYKQNIAEEYAKWEVLGKGKPAPTFTYESIDGKQVSLADFKGKYVYIDVWATWCGPCRGEIPYLKELEKEFHGKNIVFMSVSVDNTREPWEKMVKDQELAGVQLWSGAGWNTPITKDYLINGIPRFILIDRDGNIVNVKAPRPSGGIKEVINGLEGV